MVRKWATMKEIYWKARAERAEAEVKRLAALACKVIAERDQYRADRDEARKALAEARDEMAMWRGTADRTKCNNDDLRAKLKMTESGWMADLLFSFEARADAALARAEQLEGALQQAKVCADCQHYHGEDLYPCPIFHLNPLRE